MKKNLFLIVFTILSLFLVSCEREKSNETSKEDKNEIIYLTDFGEKIESISEDKQSLISNYVADCKVLYLREYKEDILKNNIPNAFVDFTDVFVYDFSNVDETKLNKKSLSLCTRIKKIRNNEVMPLMYIQINGYCQYFFGNLASDLDECSIVHGYFIYADNSVVPYMYRFVQQQVCIMDIIDGTTIINCGTKYSQKNTLFDILNFDAELKSLKLVG